MSNIEELQRNALADIYDQSNLTKHQLLMWLGQNLQPEIPLYNMAHLVTIAGELQLEHFGRAFQTLVRSSDAFRTRIEECEGIPQQRVIAPYHFELEYLDFSSKQDPADEVRRWARQRAELLFDFEERLFDSALVKISEDRHVWYFNMHHVVTDAYNCPLIFRHMSRLYQRAVEGTLEETAELPLYQDYIAYERAYRRSPQHAQAEEYWQRELAEPLEPLNFYGRAPLKQTTRVERCSYDLGAERTSRLKTLARQEGIFLKTLDVTLFNIFTTVLFTYLYRISGIKSLSVGTPFHNRDTEIFKETIGLFMQVMPLRLAVEEDDTFLSLMQRVSAKASEIRRHRQYTIANPLQNKAYDVVMNYHVATFSDFYGVRLEAEEWIYAGHENDSMSIHVHDFGAFGSFVVDFDFHCDVFDQEQREQAIRHYLQVLDSFIDNQDQLIQDVDLLSSEEREKILSEFAFGAQPYTVERTFSQLFEEQVLKTPDELAAGDENETVTYRELNERANQLAHYLRERGAGPDVCVGIFLERDLDMLIAILAVFKAGAAYVPLETEYPKERLAFILKDSRTGLLLTDARLSERLPKLDAKIIRVDAESAAINLHLKENLQARSVVENLAYIIYTSGSTGVPKGVMVEQKGMVNHLFTKIVDLELKSSDIVAQTASQCFDISVWQFLAVLLVGGRVRIVGQEHSVDPFHLLETVDGEGITMLEIVPTLLRGMINEIRMCERGEWSFARLRWLVVTGETLPPALCREWLSVYPEIPLLNAYGPTECSDDVTHHPIYLPPAADATNISIGRPVANTRLYILDRRLQPVPAGLTGELYGGGLGVGRGYVGQPGATAHAFVPDPFAVEPGQRLYKTGDLARFATDGQIEFLGRIDQQVKVRGFRIELCEIESILIKHEAIREAVVLAREDMPGDKRLAAYLVLDENAEVQSEQLRGFLREQLPEYMIPKIFVRVDALPLNGNGKVDRHALPAPASQDVNVSESYAAPQTDMEQRLARMWGDVLGLERIGINDNFFDLGGHSLLAMHLVAEMRKCFDIEFPLRKLFEMPTVAEVASYLGIFDEPGVSKTVGEVSVA